MTYSELEDLYFIVRDALIRLSEAGMLNAADALLPQLQELDEMLNEMEM